MSDRSCARIAYGWDFVRIFVISSLRDLIGSLRIVMQRNADILFYNFDSLDL